MDPASLATWDRLGDANIAFPVSPSSYNTLDTDSDVINGDGNLASVVGSLVVGSSSPLTVAAS